jgi:hypothetical protein
MRQLSALPRTPFTGFLAVKLQLLALWPRGVRAQRPAPRAIDSRPLEANSKAIVFAESRTVICTSPVKRFLEK